MEENKILNAEMLHARRVKNGYGLHCDLFFGDRDSQLKNTIPVVKQNGNKYSTLVTSKGGVWINSEGYNKLWNMIEEKLKKVQDQISRRVNLNQFPTDYYDLINMINLDLTRRRIEAMDYTSELTNVITNVNFSKSVSITEFIPFAGVFEPIAGTGDNVPMLEHKTGAKGSVEHIIYALGDARSFEDELYNLDIYSLQKVITAVNRAHTGLRNNLCIGPMIALTTAGAWHATQIVAADTTGGTYEERLYLTLRNAIRTLLGLLDEQTEQEVTASRMVLLIRNQVIQFDLNRILRGQLAGFGATVRNREVLPIDEVWMYKGDRITVGPKPTTYPGVPVNTAYLFIPGPSNAPNYTLIKRNLTQEVGRGDVLQLAHERRAWYFVQTDYNLEWYGSSHPNAPAPYNDGGYGYVVTIDLPTIDEET